MTITNMGNHDCSIEKTEAVTKGTSTCQSEHDAAPALESDLSTFHRTLPECLQRYSPSQLRSLERKLVWKMDVRILPLIIVMFVFNIIDRNGLTNARLGTLEKDTGMDGHEYNTVLMILYVGYLLAQVPSNAILPYTRPSIYLPACMAMWGCVSAATGAAKDFGGLLACRMVVGFLEAPFFPGAVFLLSCWYTRKELPSRIAFLVCGNSLSNSFGGLLAAGVMKGLDGVHGIAGWRYIFVVEGCITVGLAMIAPFLLPDWPADTKWLSDEERALAVHRMEHDVAGATGSSDEKWYTSIGAAMRDPFVWLLVLLQHALLVTMSFTYFFPSIVQTLGYSRTDTLLLTAPPYFLAFLVSVVNAWHAGQTNERFWHIAIPISVSLLGNILVTVLSGTAGRYVAMFLQAVGPYSAFCLVLSWISSSIPRPKGKRAVALALANALANCSHLYTSYIYPKSDAPQYRTGAIVLCVFSVVLVAVAGSIRLILTRRNATMERAETEAISDDSKDAAGNATNSMAFGYRFTL